MKALTQIITVAITTSIVISSSTIAAASGEEELAQLQKILAEADQVASRVDKLAALDATLQAEQSVRAQLQRRAIAESAASLVVLTSQTKPEDLATIIEDLSIMSRILDNKLGRTQRSLLIDFDSLVRGSRQPGASQTQAMYVQGYAAMFFLNVDFPLSPPPEVRVEKVKEGTDPVWEQIKRQITPSDKDLGLEYMHQRDAAARQYDKDVVEQLKTNLVKALKHAANIRNLKPDEWVVLVVAGTEPGLVVAEHGDEPHRSQWVLSETQPPMLTIRAKKADIDAYAAAKTDYDQFRQRSQILTAHAISGPRGLERTLSIIK